VTVSLSTTPENVTTVQVCTFWKVDLMHLIKFLLLPSKIWCILNTQLLYRKTTKISEIVESITDNGQKMTSNSQQQTPKIVKLADFWPRYMTPNIKGGRFYWITMYIRLSAESVPAGNSDLLQCFLASLHHQFAVTVIHNRCNYCLSLSLYLQCSATFSCRCFMISNDMTEPSLGNKTKEI